MIRTKNDIMQNGGDIAHAQYLTLFLVTALKMIADIIPPNDGKARKE